MSSEDTTNTDQISPAKASIPGHEAWLSTASFMLPSRFVPASAWNEHGPFAMWAVSAFQPRTIAELGTHYGFSYFTMCDVVRRLGLPTKTWAIDSWEGDEHAGFYGDDVYESVRAINADYADFSTLLRGYFDEQVGRFEDGAIDLLHVDGRHRYEDVRQDFETYLPKLSSRAVVLFHDIAEKHDDFGVWRYWAELAEQHPSFAFEHGHGLGVLGIGSELPETAQRFFAATAQHGGEIRANYAALGARVGRLADTDLAFEGLHERVYRAELSFNETNAGLAAANEAHARTRGELEQTQAALQQTRAELAQARAELAQARADGDAERERADELGAEADRMTKTLSWRVTAPLRAVRRIGR